MNTNQHLELIERLDLQAEHHRVEHDGRKVSWRGFGAGTPIVLLHGGHGSWLHWAKNIEALAASHRVLVPDMPGFGESDTWPPEAGFAGFIDTIKQTLDKLTGAGTEIGLAGFSFGAVVASQLALQRSDVRRIALLGPAGHGERRRRTTGLVNWRAAEDHETMMADLARNLSTLMLHGPVDPLALEIHRHSCVHTRFRSKAAARTRLLATTLKQLDLPLLMLWGEDDPTGVPEELGPLLADARSERQWEIIRGAGHWVQFEAADAVNSRLLEWFQD
jgi:pimeloyl-ACP methyl ester carboxylesterase